MGRIKKAVKSIVPYGLVELYRRRSTNRYVEDTTHDSGVYVADIRFIGRLTNKDILDTIAEEGAYIHFGQSAEDAVLSRIFQGKKNGFYVDVGAFNPTLGSNTFMFHRFLGWRGVNIDAYKQTIDEFNIARPNDININSAVGVNQGKQKMTIYSDLARNTLSDENRARQKKKGDTEVIDTQVVEVMPLSKILDLHVPRGVQIDFMDIDIEGYDLQALETNDWQKYRPTVILIEDYVINTGRFNESDIFKFMKKQEYRFFSHNFDTSIYVDNRQKVDIR